MKTLFEVKKDERCFFRVSENELSGEKSTYLCLNWSGSVNHHNPKASIEELKYQAKQTLNKKIAEGFDPQYSDKASAHWLLKELEKSKETKLF